MAAFLGNVGWRLSSPSRRGMRATNETRKLKVVVSSVAVPSFESAKEMRTRLASVVLYDEFRTTPEKGKDTFASLLVELLDALSESKQVEAAEIYARLWVSTCGASGRGWLGEVLLMICNAGGGNPLTDAALYRPIVEKHILDTAVFDLRILQALAFFNPQQLVEWINIGELPAILPEANMDERRPKKTNELIHELKTTKDWGAVVPKLVDTYRSVGVGITGEYYGLYYANGELLGVVPRHEALSAPTTRFVGIDHIYEKLLRNTECLVRGLKAQNALLYGPPGCGKSSMIKSLVGRFGEEGLRVIEVAKQELRYLPSLVATLTTLPHAFIVFIDDLSYTEFEAEAMREGKAALEGSLRANCENVAIYVTSNRRHPAVNSIADETMEKIAFSQRFGLALQFPDADRLQYAKIVNRLADDAGIDLPKAELQRRSLLWAFGHHNPTDSNGLSGRTARQFIDFLVSDTELSKQGISVGSLDWGEAPGTPWYACIEEEEENKILQGGY